MISIDHAEFFRCSKRGIHVWLLAILITATGAIPCEISGLGPRPRVNAAVAQ
jgi:hypothetical protein